MNYSRDEMDTILDESLRTAMFLLEKSGEFSPFAVMMTLNGECQIAQVAEDEEQPVSNKVIDKLRDALRVDAGQGRIKACAIVADVHIQPERRGDPTDAIRVQIEHVNAPPITCFLEYRIQRRKVKQGELTAEDGDSHVFK